MNIPPSSPDDTARFADVAAGLDAMTDAELTERFRELELRKRALEAEMAAIVHRVDRRGAYRADGHRGVPGWIRAHVNCCGGRITQLGRCGRLFHNEPDVAEQLYSGRIGLDQAAELARAHANPRCGSKLGESLELLLGHANRLKFDEFRHVVRRWEILADLDGAHRDRGDAVQARRALIAAGSNGVDLIATGGTALEAAGMEAILDAFIDAEFQADRAAAAAHSGDEVAVADLRRTHAQRAFDALVKIFHTANNSTADGTPPGVTVNVVIDQYTFERQLAVHNLCAEPADLDAPDPGEALCHTSRGVPLLPDDIVLAALGGWVRRVVVGADGVTIDLGRRSRCFTGAAAEAARLLATMCDQPGCIIPERWCQVDHMTEWEDHGPTSQHNASIACGHGNRHKHRHKLRTCRDRHGRVQVQRPDGTWMVPVGVDPPSEYELLAVELDRRFSGQRWTILYGSA